jgi:hypothetical protein
MRNLAVRALSFALLVTATAAQAATVQITGTSCSVSRLIAPSLPHMSCTGLPHLGQTCTLNYSGPMWCCFLPGDFYLPYLVLATSPTLVAIPSFVGPAQPTNCMILALEQLIQQMPFSGGFGSTPATFTTTSSIHVPNSTGLIGATLYAQWLAQIGFVDYANQLHTNCWLSSEVAFLTVGL